jgi:hypothetical protein
MSTQISDASSLRALLADRLIWREDPGYEDARTERVFNGRKPKRFPSAVLFADSIDDVVTGVHLARELKLSVSVRSGGHSWDAWSIHDDSLLIDLGNLREMTCDPATGIVSVSPAVSGGELNSYLARFEMFFPGGHCPDVGLGGFLLQGGMGWNARGWGWACEQIVAIDAVTADGAVVHADAQQHADLFWAARGSGPGFFAIVVRFYLRARPLPRAITRTTIVFSMDSYDEVMPWLQDLHTSLASIVEVVAVSVYVPLPSGPPRHSLVVNAVAFADSRQEADEALAPLETCPAMGKALARDLRVPTTLELEYVEQRRQNPKGYRYAADNLWFSGSAKEIVDAIKPCFTSLPTLHTFALWYSMAPLRQLPEMALSLQSEVYFSVYTLWATPEEDASCREWLLNEMRRMQPFSTGYYLGDSDIPTRSAKFMIDENFRRLQALREIYDPEGRICSYRRHPEQELNANPWQQAERERSVADEG